MEDEFVAAALRRAWWRLRLSARSTARAPPWDAIILTAASPQQAELYEWQLRRAKRIGRIAESTITLAVPDPDGARIGSGAATLHALAVLAAHLTGLGLLPEVPVDQKADFKLLQMSTLKYMSKRHILLLHAGGDSKRVPWANPMGKVFLPLPFLATDDPDGPVPLLFDHILAISSSAMQSFENEGGIFIMTGDVLPCFDASMMIIPDDSSCMVTVPMTLDVASNHGVVVASEKGIFCENDSVRMVEDLLQKPDFKQLIEMNAVRDDGRALLDTGIIAVRGKAWIKLLNLAISSHAMVMELLKSGKEMSLYEDLVAAWVPARHEWLKTRPLGKKLLKDLAGTRMFSYCADDLRFLHFGTSSEVLDHLSGAYSGIVGRRHMSSIPANTLSDIATSAVILSSKISPGVSVNEDSLIYDSTLTGNLQIGSHSIVVGVNIQEVNNYTFVLPSRHCLWEVPLVGPKGRIIVFCGVHDNPKALVNAGGTFCGRPWSKIFSDLGIQENDLWPSLSLIKEASLWNAKIFPIRSYSEMLGLAMWLMGLGGVDLSNLSLWKESSRISLEELHMCVDFRLLCMGSMNHQANLAAEIARASISHGLVGRDLSQLCAAILQNEIAGVGICRDFLSLTPSLLSQSPSVFPRSRAYQIQADLLFAIGEKSVAATASKKAWSAVTEETASAVKYDSRGKRDRTKENLSMFLDDSNKFLTCGYLAGLDPSLGSDSPLRSRKVEIELPVRIDFVGGWSDTPPWSLERPGCVLNMAVSLDGELPIGAAIEITEESSGIYVSDDLQNQFFFREPSSIKAPFREEDPFRLVKAALLVTGIVRDKRIWEMGHGMKIRTWAKVPRGSGLGTSSILAAAVVKGLLRVMEEDEGNDNVARVVLVVEQVMGTGGGWQDQIGGLYPGIKCTSSFPGQPLRLQIIPLIASSRLVLELQQRLLLVFTGQVRLAHQVLEKVVVRYLRRDTILISSIKKLATMAKAGREALMSKDLDRLGKIMIETWRIHQELDPHCSNEQVDRLFCLADDYCSGYKLVGAGGGGFALLLAKDQSCARDLRRRLEDSSDLGAKVYNWSVFLDQHIVVSLP